MTKFEELIEAREALNAGDSKARKDIQAGWEAELQVAWKKKFPKRKFDLSKSASGNAEEHAAISEKWRVKYEEYHKKYQADFDANKAAIEAAAKETEIPVSDEMVLCYTINSSAYASQGYGEHKYTKAAAEDNADKARAYGLKVEVREKLVAEGVDCNRHSYRNIDYEVWAGTTEAGAEILRHKPEKQTMAEWVKACDRRGVCPRVFLPFMSYEQEEAYRKA